MENIYDAGTAHPDGAGSTGLASMGFGGVALGTTIFAQDCPSFLFASNRSPNEEGCVALTNTGGGLTVYMVLTPGQFTILNEYTNGVGIVNITASATNTTLQELSRAASEMSSDFGFAVPIEFMAAFQAVS